MTNIARTTMRQKGDLFYTGRDWGAGAKYCLCIRVIELYMRSEVPKCFILYVRDQLSNIYDNLALSSGKETFC